MFSWVFGIKESVVNLASNIASSIRGIIEDIFIPDPDNIQTKINIIKAKFDFVSNISDRFIEIKNVIFNTSKVPKITVNLSSASGKYNYGDNAKILDLTWYSEYKPMVDLIIVGFCYIAFIWRLFKTLPNIISGGSAITENIYNINGYGKVKKGGK